MVPGDQRDVAWRAWLPERHAVPGHELRHADQPLVAGLGAVLGKPDHPGVASEGLDRGCSRLQPLHRQPLSLLRAQPAKQRDLGLGQCSSTPDAVVGVLRLEATQLSEPLRQDLR